MNVAIGIADTLIKIDENGDSEGNFTVLAAKERTKEEASNFSCRYVMRPIAHFLYGVDFPVCNHGSYFQSSVTSCYTLLKHIHKFPCYTK